MPISMSTPIIRETFEFCFRFDAMSYWIVGAHCTCRCFARGEGEKSEKGEKKTLED